MDRGKKKKNSNSSNIKMFFTKLFIIVFVVLFGTLILKKNNVIKKNVYNKIYNSHLSFAVFKNIYNNYIGNILPFENIIKDKKVFNEKLEYNSLSRYNKGIKLKLTKNYPIPIIKGGLVIYNGKKDGMNTVIIQQSDGIDVWYCNLLNTNVKLYDYLENNSIIGEAKNDELYLQFYKDGLEVDYKKVLK